MQHHQPHPGKNPLLDPVDQRIIDPVVRAMPPPDQHVGFIQHRFREPLPRLVQRCGPDLEIGRSQLLRETRMDSRRIDGADIIACGPLLPFMHELVPDDDPDFFHETKFPFRKHMLAANDSNGSAQSPSCSTT